AMIDEGSKWQWSPCGRDGLKVMVLGREAVDGGGDGLWSAMGRVPSSSFLNSYRRLQRLAGDALLGDGKRWRREVRGGDGEVSLSLLVAGEQQGWVMVMTLVRGEDGEDERGWWSVLGVGWVVSSSSKQRWQAGVELKKMMGLQAMV
ncbi:hypothetical protein Dimus_026694, partial [Dionaea muscipula]